MPRRTRKPARPTTCPCGSGDSYTACCGRFHSGAAAAPTAEALMRSRYSAFAVGDEAYLLRTWHPDTRPDRVDLAADGRTWTGLDVLTATGGTALHTTGTVHFRAHYTDADGEGTQTENSTFERLGGAWFYVDALAFE